MKVNFKRVTDWYSETASRRKYILGAMKRANYTLLGEGRMRITFLAPHKRFVLKLPLSERGQSASAREAELWAKYQWKPIWDGTVIAPCRMIGGVMLMMRTVVELYGYTEGCRKGRQILPNFDLSHRDGRMPNWAHKIDCMQVGRLANGKLVAYDYGSNL
jgi:hypothetical protein